MSKEDILKRIENAEKELNEAKKELENYKEDYEEWTPKEYKEYYYVTSGNKVDSTIFYKNYDFDENNIKTYNYFKTEKEAKIEAEKIVIRRILEKIAKKLNYELKQACPSCIFNYCYTIKYTPTNFPKKLLLQLSLHKDNFKEAGLIYCYSNKFLEVAKKEIGEDRLINYFKGEYNEL